MVYSIRHSSRRDSRIPLRLVYLGFQHGLELSNHPNGVSFCMLYYCTEGKGEFVLNGERVILRPGQCVLVLPETPYSCKALPGDGRSAQSCVIHLLGFTGACCAELFRVCGVETTGIYQVSDRGVIPDAMEQLLSLHRQDAVQEAYSKVCYSLLIDLSSRIERLTNVPAEARLNDAVQMVIDYLETHYRDPISLDTLADEVHLTKEYLCVLFKKETGHTILHRLTLIRIGWARLYLEQYPDKKAYEIGRMCGFENPSYFGKKFREVVGMTPDAYRRVNSIVV